MKIICLLMSWAAIAILPVQAQESPKVLDYIICRSGKVVRTIRTIEGGDGFQTYYTKGGIDKIVAEGRWKQSCDNVANNIRSNLEKAGWRCKNAEGVKFTQIAPKSP